MPPFSHPRSGRSSLGFTRFHSCPLIAAGRGRLDADTAPPMTPCGGSIGIDLTIGEGGGADLDDDAGDVSKPPS